MNELWKVADGFDGGQMKRAIPITTFSPKAEDAANTYHGCTRFVRFPTTRCISALGRDEERRHVIHARRPG
jgi:hypothetical protein